MRDLQKATKRLFLVCLDPMEVKNYPVFTMSLLDKWINVLPLLLAITQAESLPPDIVDSLLRSVNPNGLIFVSDNLGASLTHEITKLPAQFIIINENKTKAAEQLAKPILENLVLVDISSVTTLIDILVQSLMTNLIMNVWVIVGMNQTNISEILERLSNHDHVKLSINIQLYFLTDIVDGGYIVQVEGNVYQGPRILVRFFRSA